MKDNNKNIKRNTIPLTLYKRNAQGCGHIERKLFFEPRRNFCKFQLFRIEFTCNLQKFRLLLFA